MINPSKYIFNSQLATLKNDNEYTLSLTLPESFVVASGQAKVWSASVATTGNTSASFRSFVTSSKYSYAIQSYSFSIKAKQDGFDSQLVADIYRSGNEIRLEVVATGGWGGNSTWSEMGQTLTVHIQTFTDPFL